MTECSIDTCVDDIKKLKILTDLLIKLEVENVRELEAEEGSCILYGLYKIDKVAITRLVATAGTKIGFHKHDTVEVLGVYEGRMEININGQKYIIPEGEVCVIDPGVPHFAYFPIKSSLWAVSMPAAESFPKGL